MPQAPPTSESPCSWRTLRGLRSTRRRSSTGSSTGSSGCEAAAFGCCADGATAKADEGGSNCASDLPGPDGGCAGTEFGCCTPYPLRGPAPLGTVARADAAGSNCPCTKVPGDPCAVIEPEFGKDLPGGIRVVELDTEDANEAPDAGNDRLKAPAVVAPGTPAAGVVAETAVPREWKRSTVKDLYVQSGTVGVTGSVVVKTAGDAQPPAAATDVPASGARGIKYDPTDEKMQGLTWQKPTMKVEAPEGPAPTGALSANQVAPIGDPMSDAQPLEEVEPITEEPVKADGSNFVTR